MNFITEGLVVAAREGNFTQVQDLVTNKHQSANIVSSKYKVTPLHAARYAKKVGEIKFLFPHR